MPSREVAFSFYMKQTFFQIISKWREMDTMLLTANIQISLYRKEKLRANAAP